tara:strand:- start:998 stop:1303 length:306 start_codon:yes stop_codon:yes gene_type:complete
MENKKNKFNYIIQYLKETIEEKEKSNDMNSYTCKLINKDLSRIIQKVGEEAIEVVIAAGKVEKKDLINESADLLFHLLILLRKKDISLDEIADELIKRKKK